jgi:T-complex protein 1 subunit eta
VSSLELLRVLETLTLTGTDQSQGRGQIISNINACLAVQSTIKGTLGPYGGDLLMVDANGRQTITNDGATVMKVAEPESHER